MRTYQDIEKDIRTVADQTAQMAFMNKEQIFAVLAMLISLSDELNSFMREIDLKIADAEKEARDSMKGQKITASLLELMTKQYAAPLKADKAWADRQLNLLRDLRIAALAAQRSAEN